MASQASEKYAGQWNMCAVQRATSKPNPASDDSAREAQASHRDSQNRTKKDGHVSQIGSGQEQSQRSRGAGARSKG